MKRKWLGTKLVKKVRYEVDEELMNEVKVGKQLLWYDKNEGELGEVRLPN